MANKKTECFEILNEYEQLSDIKIEDSWVAFNLNGNKYGMCLSSDYSFPRVFTIDNNSTLPHFLLKTHEIDGKTITNICLFESGTMIEYIHTDTEKIRICIEQLIRLTELSHDKIVEEYQKEFLVYWGWSCDSKSKYSSFDYQLYIDNEENYNWLEQQVYKNKHIRITNKDRWFNDAENVESIDKIPVLYLPLKDIRNLLPPINCTPWQAKDICNIVNSVSYERISKEAYEEIKNKSYSYKSIMLVFKLNSYYFGCVVEFKNPGTAKLIHKFESQIEKVTPVKISRCDFVFLNQQIGNEIHNEKISIIGVGSLGSYISSELARAGYKNITLIDEDKYEPANVFRHRIEFFPWRNTKSRLMAYQINLIHPELNAKHIEVNLSAETIDKCETNNADIIIYTVGSSDAQLKMNRIFKEKNINKKILYTWLEYDGKTCHAAVIDGFEKGCFECLFTNDSGDLCANTINIAPPKEINYVRNGCGGTRIPYGNKVLLDASSLVLKALNNNSDKNLIYSYVNDSVEIKEFQQNEGCNCCGV